MSYLILGIIIFGADQLTKVLLFGKEMSLIGDFLWLKRAGLNTGAAWGSFDGGRWIFVAVSVVIAGLIVYLMFSKKHFKSRFFKLSLGIMLGGLLGNLFDRIVLGGVRDFLAFNFFDFPVFNVADIAITVATIMLIVYIIFFYGKDEARLKTKGETDDGKDNNCE